MKEERTSNLEKFFRFPGTLDDLIRTDVARAQKVAISVFTYLDCHLSNGYTLTLARRTGGFEGRVNGLPVYRVSETGAIELVAARPVPEPEPVARIVIERLNRVLFVTTSDDVTLKRALLEAPKFGNVNTYKFVAPGTGDCDFSVRVHSCFDVSQVKEHLENW